MSTTLGFQVRKDEDGDQLQEANDRAIRGMLADLPREITLEVTPEYYAALEQLMRDTGQNLEDVFVKAIALYKSVVEFKCEGKHVGTADDVDKLEREFVGLGSPGTGL
jgi:hypothetical protein